MNTTFQGMFSHFCGAMMLAGLNCPEGAAILFGFGFLILSQKD